MEQQDIYKVAVSVVMIHLMLLFVIEGFAFTSSNPSDSIVMNAFNVIPTSWGIDSQMSEVGLCLDGTATKSECEAHGCVWDSGQCFNAIENRKDVNFGFFDVLLSILKIPLYLGKFLLFIGSLMFFELILSFKLMPLLTNSVLRMFVTLTLWVYNSILVYFLWNFISNWRGSR